MATGESKQFFVYDRRSTDAPAKIFEVSSSENYQQFRGRIIKEFNLPLDEKFVICTTNREEVNLQNFNILENNDTLYVLNNLHQELSAQTLQKVDYLPHYDTIIKSGMYEYYASEGQNPLPYAFAELIDNSLAATSKNTGARKIELKLFLDDSTASERSMIFVMDNGCGMTSWQLNNWAIYKLSKFIRKERSLTSSECDSSNRSSKQHCPRFLNSEISYFGAGGKQAIFFIGNATRMITKPRDSKDVHELMISKDEFEKREKDKSLIYSGSIVNRKAGDHQHIPSDEEYLQKIIAEEVGKDSFTCVVLWGISSEHVQFLKHNYETWCTQLAHIYHYYLHGPEGNVDAPDEKKKFPFQNLTIEVSLMMKSGQCKVTNLRNIDNDLQTQFIRSSASMFDFKGTVDGTRVVEGQIRYHPFLYDHETYPPEAADPRIHQEAEDDHDYFTSDVKPARGQRPIFECFWNGRLIPYTTVDCFEWCATPKKPRNIPLECYNRVSGVLWTDDAFQVSTNKLTFMDLENKLREKNNTVFARILNGQVVRASIEKHFLEWLQQCHEQCDKQIVFSEYKETISRKDTLKYKQYPWAVFNCIEWDGKKFKKGQLVRTQRTNPIIIGTINRFLLYGDHTDSVYATGGEVEIIQEPKVIYGELKILPLAKLDRKINDGTLEKIIEEEENKLPDRLVVTWPEGDQLFPNEKRPAGKAIGDIKVEILNRKGESISKLPGPQNRRLTVELKIVWHSPSGDQVVTQYISPYNKSWCYWFRKMENVQNIGFHTLTLQAMLSESNSQRSTIKDLPSYKIRFTVTEAEPEKFNVGYLEGPFRVGTPFQIPLEFLDKFGNPTKPVNDLKPDIRANGLDLTYEGIQTKGNSLIIKGIIAKGIVESNSGKSFTLNVRIPGLAEDAQTLKIRLLPGPAYELQVLPEIEDLLVFENGFSPVFEVAVLDMAGNYTCEPRFLVNCKFTGSKPGAFPTYTLDLSNSCKSTLTGPPLTFKHIMKEEKIIAKFEVQNNKHVPVVERSLTVRPSHTATSLHMSCIGEDGNKMALENNRDLSWTAGEPITGLKFEIQDECGKAIPLSQAVASKIKLNWTSSVPKDMLATNSLPDIMCPSSIKQHLYCHMSVTIGNGIDFSFTVKPKNGDPANLKSECKGTHDVRIGEVHQADIIIIISDKFNNPVKKLTLKDLAQLLIIADGLEYTHVEKALDQTSGFFVKGLKFTDTKPGVKEVCFQWNGLKDYVRLNLIPGPPVGFTFLDYSSNEPVIVSSDGKLPRPLIVQLLDKEENPSSESQVKLQLNLDDKLKAVPVIPQVKTDSKGRASFGMFTISPRNNIQPKPCDFNICTNNCRGCFTLSARGQIGRTVILGPVLKLHMTCDPDKPLEVKYKYQPKDSYFVGEDLPEISVQVIAEDGNTMLTTRGSHFTMKLFKGHGHSKNVKVQEISPSNSTSTNGIFFFRKVKLPQEAGDYSIQFVYDNGKYNCESNTIFISISSGPPAKLLPSPAVEGGMLTVSNQEGQDSRRLIKAIKLEVKDKFGNTTGHTLNGNLVVHIEPVDPSVKVVPNFQGDVNTFQVPILKGIATLQNVYIQENTEGLDGCEYAFCCTPVFPKSQLKGSVDPWKTPFLFYNDAAKKEEMASLSRKKTELERQIETFKDLFSTTENIYKELEGVIKEAQNAESKIRGQLRKIGFNSNQIREEGHVTTALENCEKQKKVLDVKRRVFGSQPYPDEPGVLGKIGHLAWVEDEKVAAVLSWHMSRDIDCVVTESMEKAREIFKKTNGQQQVVAVDSIFKRYFPKQLPHIKNRNFVPSGNPKFALDYFIFQKNPDVCRTVFANFIGETIVLDTLDDALRYRTEVTKVTACPTLLTKSGEKVFSTGKFGGQRNKAPSLGQLGGNVFGEPPKKDLEIIEDQIQLMRELATTIKEQKEARLELERQKKSDTTFHLKQQECNSLKKELGAVESKIASISAATLASRNSGRRSLPAKLTQEEEYVSERRQSIPLRGRKAASKQLDNTINGAPTRTGRNASQPALTSPERKRRRI